MHNIAGGANGPLAMELMRNLQAQANAAASKRQATLACRGEKRIADTAVACSLLANRAAVGAPQWTVVRLRQVLQHLQPDAVVPPRRAELLASVQYALALLPAPAARPGGVPGVPAGAAVGSS
jgi:hypothetical protein